MPKLKATDISPSTAESQAIEQGISSDPDARGLNDQWFDEAEPVKISMANAVFNQLVEDRRSRGRPKLPVTKVSTSIRLDADVLDAFKATGQGWQTRMNAALRQYIATQHTKR